MCDHYRTLGITKEATRDEIRDAFSIATQKYHPDTNPDQAAQEEYLRIQQAYEVLSDLVKRQVYDASQERENEQILVEVDTIYSNETLVRLDEPQRVYAMVTIRCKTNSKSYKRIPANICLVVDIGAESGESRKTVPIVISSGFLNVNFTCWAYTDSSAFN